jgi:hypothetical protein
MPVAGEDYHFPEEEPEERRQMMALLPAVVSVENITGNASGTALLSFPSTDTPIIVSVGDTVMNWTVVSFLVPLLPITQDGRAPASATMVVLERLFNRWSALVYLQGGHAARKSSTTVIRSGVGTLEQVKQPAYVRCLFLNRLLAALEDVIGIHDVATWAPQISIWVPRPESCGTLCMLSGVHHLACFFCISLTSLNTSSNTLACHTINRATTLQVFQDPCYFERAVENPSDYLGTVLFHKAIVRGGSAVGPPPSPWHQASVCA